MVFYKYFLIFIFLIISCRSEKQNNNLYVLDSQGCIDLEFIDSVNINNNNFINSIDVIPFVFEIVSFFKVDSLHYTNVIITITDNNNLSLFSLNPFEEIFSLEFENKINDIIKGDSGLLIVFNNGFYNYLSYSKLQNTEFDPQVEVISKYEGNISDVTLFHGFFYDKKFFIINKKGNLYIIKEQDFEVKIIELSDITGIGQNYFEIYNNSLYLITQTKLYCIDLKNNSVNFSKRINSYPFSFDFFNDSIFISNLNGLISVYDSNLNFSQINIDSYSTGSFIEIYNNNLYYLSPKGLLTRYSLELGINVWQKNINKCFYIKPYFYHNIIILTSYDRYLIMINCITGEIIKEVKFDIEINNFRLYKDYIIILDYSWRLYVYKII